MFEHRRLIMLSAVAALAAVVCFSTIADFLPCGDALHRAVGWMGLAAEPERIGPLWGWLVRWCNCRAAPMGCVSATFGVANAVLVAYIGWCLFPVAIAYARTKHTTGHSSSRFLWIAEEAGALFAAAFIVTPGFWMAATRLNGLMVALVFPLAALALLAHIIVHGIHRHTVNWCFSETLASAQISAGRLDAAEKALATAMQCAEEAKVQPEARNALDLTQARLWKVQGNVAELRPLVQSLKKRDNLRPDQQRVLAWLEKGF